MINSSNATGPERCDNYSDNNLGVNRNHTLLQDDRNSQSIEERRRSTPPNANPLIGLLCISALFLPMTTIPFLLVRKRLAHIQKTLDRTLQTYDDSFRSEVQRIRSAQEGQQKWLQNLDKQLLMLSAEHNSAQKNYVKEQMGIERRLEENDMRFRQYIKDRQDLHTSIDESSARISKAQVQLDNLTQTSLEHNRIFGRVGRSLADVAAFMHETEVRHGIIPDRNAGGNRRVDALRALGYDLHARLSKEPSQHK